MWWHPWSCAGACETVNTQETPAQWWGGVLMISELNWWTPSQPCHQCWPVSAYRHPRVTRREPQVQGTPIMGHPEHPPPRGDGSSAVPEPTLLPPSTVPHCPQPAPAAVPSLGGHKSATHLHPTATRGSPWAAAAWGQGGRRGDGSSSRLTSRHRQHPQRRQAPVLSPVFPARGPGGGPAPSQRPRLAAGGAGSAGFRQKPARTRNGPAGRGSIWAELTTAQPDVPSTGHRQHGEPHTHHSAPRTHCGCHPPGFLIPNET